MILNKIQLHLYSLMLFCTITSNLLRKKTFKSCISWHFTTNWMFPMSFGINISFWRLSIKTTRQWSPSQMRFCYWVGIWRTFSVHEGMPLPSLVKVPTHTSILETSLTNEIRNKLKRKYTVMRRFFFSIILLLLHNHSLNASVPKWLIEV